MPTIPQLPVAAAPLPRWVGRAGSRLIVYTPADADCRERLEKLAADL